jgi:1-acyl-sn-glycerol-3-phosphate acyltransferase
MEPFVHMAYWCLFRKVYVYNVAGVATNKPILIAANHPTAFVDPIALCIYLHPPVYNMTRGDIFQKPWARWLLEQVNMFPVFRMRDGYTGRDRNDGVVEYCQSKMLKKQTVAIYVEGEHHLDKQIRPIQKGLARIAFETYSNHRLEDLQVVPVGTNYIWGDRTRDELKMLVGEPIFIRDYWAAYQENSGIAINRLNAEIDKALKKLCYHVQDPADAELAEQMLTLVRNDFRGRLFPVVEAGNLLFQREHQALETLNDLTEPAKEVIKNRSNAYFSALQHAGLTDAGLRNPQQSSGAWLLFLILMALPAALGYVMAWPVRYAARTLTGKVVKKREFVTSVLMGVGTVTGVAALLVSFVVALLFKSPVLIALVVLAPLLAWFAFFYRDCMWRYRAAQDAAAHPERAGLLRQREALTSSLLEKAPSGVAD